MRKLVVIALAAAFAAPASAAADEVVATEAYITQLSSAHGMALWLQSDFKVGGWRARLFANGVVRTIPIPQPVPDDVRLGADEHGHMAVVYSRCHAAPGTYAKSRCDLYEYGVRSRREVKLALANTRSSSEFMPALDRGLVAFVRERDGIAKPAPAVFVYNPRRHRVTRMPPLPPGLVEPALDDGYTGPSVSGLDISRGRVAVSWQSIDKRCTDWQDEYVEQGFLWLLTRHAKRLIAGSVNCMGAYESTAAPILTPTGVLYTTRGELGRRVITRFDLASGAKTTSSGFEDAAMLDGDESLMFRMRTHDHLALWDVVRSAPQFAPAP